MGSCSPWRAGLGAKLKRVRAIPVHRLSAIWLSAAGVVLGPTVHDAAAQTDAGLPSGSVNARARDLTRTVPGSAYFQKTIEPSQLPESVQRRLRERAGANPSPQPPEPRLADTPRALSETARRIGEARMRRVQAFETGNGVTILSNRLAEMPTPTRVSARAPGPMLPREGETLIAPPALTETRSLRAAVVSPPMPEDANLRAWLWPFVALLTVSAGFGALFYGRAFYRRTSSGKASKP